MTNPMRADYLRTLRQPSPCCCHWRVLVVPALSRRSGDVGSLLPPRSSRSKPRTPLSMPSEEGSATGRCVCGGPRRTLILPARSAEAGRDARAAQVGGERVGSRAVPGDVRVVVLDDVAAHGVA